MHPFFQNTRFRFKEEGKDPVYLENAPLGYDRLEQTIKRSKKSDGIVRNRIQNLEFVHSDKDKLANYRSLLGVGGNVQIIGEKKKENDFLEQNKGYLELSTLEYNKNTATVDFADTIFDEILNNNAKEKFELDRLEDIKGNTIPALDRSIASWFPREIFLRSELNEIEYSESFVSDVTITPKMNANPVSDPDVFYVLDPYVVDPIGAADVYSSNTFMFDSSRSKLLTLDVDIDVTVSVYTQVQIHIYKYNNGDALDYVERTQLGSSFTTSGDPVTFTGSVDIEVEEGESLMLGLEITSGTYTVTVNTSQIIISEDTFYQVTDPSEREFDCITLKAAFERITKILDSNVVFKSDYIDTYWPDLVITSGETMRHVLLNNEKVVLATLSFDDLYKFLFTLAPVAFGIETIGLQTYLVVEEIEYFFDSERTIDFNTISDANYKDNTDKIFSGIAIGYNKSGKNEEVFGLQVTHAVNSYNLPANSIDNVYDATCDFRTDPNELELCFRKQYSQFPDEDTKYDKDILAFDCSFNGATYRPYDWTTHFAELPTGIYSPNTAYNYRLSPMNCLLRHPKNFKQEYAIPAYSSGQIVYQSTTGNSELSTKLQGGVARPENGSVNLSDLEDPLYSYQIVEGAVSTTDAVIEQINGYAGKPNYYGTGVFIDDLGNEIEVFVSSLIIEDDIKVELYIKR